MATRNEQAGQLFKEIVEEILSGQADLVSILRKAYHACVLAGWSETAEWFRRELEGYPADIDLPDYRRGISGQVEWVAASLYDIPAHIATRMTYGEPEAPESRKIDCWC